MTEQAEQLGVDESSAANNAIHNDIGPVDGDGLSSTPSSKGRDSQFDSNKLAQIPEIADAFDKVFGTGSASSRKAKPTKPEAPATRRKDRQEIEAEAEEIEDLEGDEVDDGVEPEGDKETKPKDAGQKPNGQDADQGTEGKEGKDDAEGEDVPTLSPILRHAAKRAGWKDADIDKLIKTDPAMAEEMCTRLLKSFNDLSAEYGRLGANFQQGQLPPQNGGSANKQQPSQQPPQQQTDDLLTQLYGEKFQELSKKYGDDFMEDILKPLLGPVQEMYMATQKQAIKAVANEVGSFFKGLPEEFGELYGKADQVSDEQFEARKRLAQMADQIQYGARRQGIELSVSECLERANLMFAAEHLGSIERKRITKQVQKRSKQITQRPSQRRQPSADGGKKGDEAAMSAYESKAAELGYEV